MQRAQVADPIPRRERLLYGVAARLLALTIAAVLAVATLIFIPSATAFRESWLSEKIDTARLATLAALAAPDLTSSDELAQRLLAQAEVEAVGVKRAGQRELILTAAPAESPPVRVDLREMSFWTSMTQTLATFLAPDDRQLLIMDSANMDDVEFIEVLVEEAALKEDIFRFGRRALLAVLAITSIVAAVIYAALAYLFVAPLRRMVRAMARFREAPEDPTRALKPSGRGDEIGEAEAALAELQAQVRQSLSQRARLAALGEAVAKINHDLRNVLSSAQLISDRLAQSPDPQIRAQGERLVRSIDRGVRLAQDVLRYGKAEERAPAREQVELAPVLEEAFTDAVSAAGSPVSFALDVDTGAAVRGDEEFLHRIFLNLLRNAVAAAAGRDAHPQDGAPTVSVSAARTDGYWVVKVGDNGPGVPRKAQERLFQPFAGGAAASGSGLGLAIARELARAMDGDVALESTGPQGATFAVRLPAAS